MKTTKWTRGSAALECAIGTVVLLAVSVAGFDLYRLSSAQAKTTRSAVTMAEYASQEAAPVANTSGTWGSSCTTSRSAPGWPPS